MQKFVLFVAVSCLSNFVFGEVSAQEKQTKEELNNNCVELCGQGYFYDRPGAKRGGREIVCTRYKLGCGYGCTIGWNFEYLVRGTDYTCQDAIQFNPDDEIEVDTPRLKARSL